MPHKLYSLFMFTRGEKRELSGHAPLAFPRSIRRYTDCDADKRYARTQSATVHRDRNCAEAIEQSLVRIAVLKMEEE